MNKALADNPAVRECVREVLQGLHEDVALGGGQTSIANYIGVSVATLRAMLNSPDRLPNMYYLVRIIEETGGRRTMDALARHAGLIVAEVPATVQVNANVVAEVLKHTAKVLETYAVAIKDGTIDAEERKRLEDEIRDTMSALAGLQGYIKAQYEQGRLA